MFFILSILACRLSLINNQRQIHNKHTILKKLLLLIIFYFSNIKHLRPTLLPIY